MVEKSLAVGLGGILSNDVQLALSGLDIPVQTIIAGLGGRAITKASLRRCFEGDFGSHMEPLFLDLNGELIQRHLERGMRLRPSGPTAENLLRDLRMVAAEIG